MAEQARRALRLDQVWLLVSPGNPLKPRAGMAPFARRLASAEAIADGVRVVATGLEAAIGQRYSARTLARLQRLFPRVRFVWIIGADNLWQLPRWRRWRALAARTPIAVLPRPGWTDRALRGAAASTLRRHRRLPGALLAPAAIRMRAGAGAGPRTPRQRDGPPPRRPRHHRDGLTALPTDGLLAPDGGQALQDATKHDRRPP
ncbi:nucleotidyl transferase family protein [Teichococcus aestuarii]|uniref:nicotinic acid mononucleotide adenylyltransferase n=1 Tax=Teichococcus aestuarii TaxID=568898 RepID=UPI00361E0DE8